jgi:ankyrin repeat protein
MARGKKGTAKKGQVAKKREKEEDERENEGEEEERKKQKVAEEEEAQEKLNEEFLYACVCETVYEVKDVVERGADLLHCNKHGLNGLQLACQNKDYEVAEEIALYLIKKHKVFLRMFDNKQWSALHAAARRSSAKICEILIDNGCDVNGTSKRLYTPLILCCNRADTEALKITKLLIERGADLSRKDDDGATALHYACMNESDEVVQALVDAKADVNSQNNIGLTPLMLAARNSLFGEKIIPILIQGGAVVTLKDNKGATAVRHTYLWGGGKMMKVLAPFFPEGITELKGFLPGNDCPDPIGSMVEGLPFGASPRTQYFDLAVRNDQSPAFCWAMLRNGEFDFRTAVRFR